MNDKVGLKPRIQLALLSAVQFVSQKHPAAKATDNDKLVLNAFIWDAVLSFAKAASEDAWGKMEGVGLYKEPSRDTPSDELIGAARYFEVHGKVTEPVKRFNDGELAKLLKASKYKIPEHVTKEFVDKAKVGKKGNLLLSIVEKGT